MYCRFEVGSYCGNDFFVRSNTDHITTVTDGGNDNQQRTDTADDGGHTDKREQSRPYEMMIVLHLSQQ